MFPVTKSMFTIMTFLYKFNDFEAKNNLIATAPDALAFSMMSLRVSSSAFIFSSTFISIDSESMFKF